MVRLTHKMAIESEMITADAVEVMEFPQLAVKYRVQGVPRTVANETLHIEGLVPEGRLLKQVLDELK
jgi:hypothetical protein